MSALLSTAAYIFFDSSSDILCVYFHLFDIFIEWERFNALIVVPEHPNGSKMTRFSKQLTTSFLWLCILCKDVLRILQLCINNNLRIIASPQNAYCLLRRGFYNQFQMSCKLYCASANVMQAVKCICRCIFRRYLSISLKTGVQSANAE
jgi:hypothetical protein